MKTIARENNCKYLVTLLPRFLKVPIVGQNKTHKIARKSINIKKLSNFNRF